MTAALVTMFALACDCHMNPKTAYRTVRNWQRRFLDREPDAAGMASWSYLLKRGDNPRSVLAKFLSTDEYYRHCGGTTEAFVARIFKDFRRSASVLAQWQRWAANRDRHVVVSAFLEAVLVGGRLKR